MKLRGEIVGNLNELLARAKVLNNDINTILKYSKYEDYDDLSGLDIDYKNPEEMLLLDEIRGIMQKLESVNDDINYLSRPIKSTGTLFKNQQGKYEMDNGYKTYSCGHTIEAYLYDDFDERYAWVVSSVEHDGNDYYITRYKGVKLDGLKVRVRG